MKKTLIVLFSVLALMLVLSACSEPNSEISEKYQVCFASDGEAIFSMEISAGSTVNAPASPTKEGYNFLGWTVDGELATFPYEISKNTTFVAKWESSRYKIILDLDGGVLKNGEKTTIEVIKGEQITSLPEPTKAGYNFVGWKIYGKFIKVPYTPGGNVILHAFYEEKPETVDVYLDPNGGTLPEGAPDIISVELYAPIGRLPIPTRDGYKFLGWFEDGNERWEVDRRTTVVYEMEIVALWEPLGELVTVEFTVGAGEELSWDINYIEVVKGQSLNTVLVALPTAKRPDYKFKGWKDYTTGATITITSIIDRDMVLIPIWEEAITCLDGTENHTWNAWYAVSEATCTTPAQMARQCNACGHTEYNVRQEALGHTYEREDYDGKAGKTLNYEELVYEYACQECSVIKTEKITLKYDYNMDEYITLADLTNYAIELDLDALQAAIDSYLLQSATDYIVTRGDNIYVDITVYEEMTLVSNTGEIIGTRGDKIESLSKSNYLIENLGTSSLFNSLETDIINGQLGLKDTIARKYAYDQLEGYAPVEYEGQNLYFYIKILNKKTEPGDVVQVSYEAFLVDEDNSIILDDDGNETPFDKGTSSSFFLGSHLAIDDFENGLIGVLLYEEQSFYVTFPEDYFLEEFRGKRALFKATINDVFTAPVYNDYFVKEYFDFETTIEFENELRKSYLQEKIYEYLNNNSETLGYPVAEYNKYEEDIEASSESFEIYYGITFEEYIKQMGYESIDEYIKSNMKTEMIYYALSKKLNVAPTKEMLINERESLVTYYKSLYMEQNGLDEQEALKLAEELVDSLGFDYIYENVLYQLVEDELLMVVKVQELERTYESISEIIAKENE